MIEFRDIKGYEGEYQISNDGRVYSLPRRNGNFVGSGKFRKLQKHPEGYVIINLRKSDNWLVHRLVALAFLPCMTIGTWDILWSNNFYSYKGYGADSFIYLISINDWQINLNLN